MGLKGYVDIDVDDTHKIVAVLHSYISLQAVSCILMSSCIPNCSYKSSSESCLASITCFNASNFQGLDFIVDGGPRIADPSTVVDMMGANPTVIRQGKVSTLYHLLIVHSFVK